jgi:predicted RNase H-like nuclease (RuvC/YqgF family)
VGLDPGTTTGIAALNLSGDLVDLISARAMSSSEVIEWIAARGRPLMVATDVFPTPGSVEKVKRAFNAVLYSPGADVPAEEKISLGKEFGYRNDHERDALAAAASAFKKYKNKFFLVEKKVSSEIDPDEVKALVVKGYSIENAVLELTEKPAMQVKPPAQPETAHVPPADAAIRSQNQQLMEQVRTLRSYVDELGSEMEKKEAANHALNAKLDRQRDKTAREIKRHHEIKIRDKEIDRLRSVLRSERKYIKKLKKSLARQKKTEKIEAVQGLRRIKMLEAFSREAVLLAQERWGLEKGDLVYLVDATGGGKSTAEQLQETGIDAVITECEMAPALQEHFLELNIPVFTGKRVPVRVIEGLPFVRPEDVEMARGSWEEEKKAWKAKQQAEKLESIFQEYRVERKKEAKRKQKLG